MADSIHTQVVDAVIARLDATISVANGYNFDLSPQNGGGGAQPIRADFQTALKSPWILVDLWREDKEDTYATVAVVTAQLHMQLNVERPADSDERIHTTLQQLVDDVEKCLGLARQEDPRLGVAGLQDILLQGHTKVPWDDDDDYMNAIMEIQVLFQHSITDPTSPT